MLIKVARLRSFPWNQNKLTHSYKHFIEEVHEAAKLQSPIQSLQNKSAVVRKRHPNKTIFKHLRGLTRLRPPGCLDFNEAALDYMMHLHAKRPHTWVRRASSSAGAIASQQRGQIFLHTFIKASSGIRACCDDARFLSNHTTATSEDFKST